jgi:hypothetical protein
LLGSVASTVVEQAPCTVTVVRQRHDATAPDRSPRSNEPAGKER